MLGNPNDNIIIRKEENDSGIDGSAYVKGVMYGEYLDLRSTDNPNSKYKRKPNCKKLAKGKYVNTETGELIEAQQHDSRGDNFKLLVKSAHRLFMFIHTNFPCNEGIHVTLTYAKYQSDDRQVYSDFKKFWQKVRYHYPNLGYIAVLEPQQNGSWHLHVLMKDVVSHESIFISYYKLREFWTQGTCYVIPMHPNEDYGYYFCKKINKHNPLLVLYKPGVRYFRYSRNMQKPLEFVALLDEVNQFIMENNYHVINEYSISVSRLDDYGDEQLLKQYFYRNLRKDNGCIYNDED